MLSDGFSLCWNLVGFATSRMWIPTACPNPPLRRVEMLELIGNGPEALHILMCIYIYIYICIWVNIYIVLCAYLCAYHALLGQTLWEDPVINIASICDTVSQIWNMQLSNSISSTWWSHTMSPGPQEVPETCPRMSLEGQQDRGTRKCRTNRFAPSILGSHGQEIHPGPT